MFDLCLNYLPFGNLAVKSRHLFLCWHVLLIYFVMIRLFVIYLSYLNIDNLLQIAIPLSRSQMFYIILNVYIFNSFKEPLALNSMAYLVKDKKKYGLLSIIKLWCLKYKKVWLLILCLWAFAWQPPLAPSETHPNTLLLQKVIELVDDGHKMRFRHIQVCSTGIWTYGNRN